MQGSSLVNVTMQLVGPNPEPGPENEKHVKAKKADTRSSYDSFDIIIDTMSAKTLAKLQKHYDKGSK